MSKGDFFLGQPVFAQLLRMIPRWEVQKSAKKFSADHYCNVFRTYEHLTVMLYAIFNKCTSLREVITGIMACHSKLLHLGLDYTIRRSTLSDARGRSLLRRTPVNKRRLFFHQDPFADYSSNLIVSSFKNHAR